MDKTIWKSKPFEAVHVYSPDGYNVICFESKVVGGDIIIDFAAAESLALALLDDLGKGWKPYPENRPKHQGDYYIQFKMGGHLIAEWDGKEFVDGVTPCDVIAYRELPAPFQPEES